MMFSGFWPLFSLLLISTANATDLHTDNQSRRALSQPMPMVKTAKAFEQFTAGRSLFNQMWVIAPSQSDAIDGLGPLYNSLSCLQCHPGNGRGRAPDGANERMRSMLVRLSEPGDNLFYAEPHPVYGDQLQELAVPGVAAEGYATIDYGEHTVTLADGKTVSLRQPNLQLHAPEYGDWGEILTSARVGPTLIGMALIEAIDPQAILALAISSEPKPNGVSGRVNWVWDPMSQQQQIGRFGYKATIATLAAQIAVAFHEDLGLTSALFPDESCTATQTTCQQAESGGSPELTVQQLDAVQFYLGFLAIPQQRNTEDESVVQGRQIFEHIGCVACHVPQLATRKDAQPTVFANRLIAPYSDFLLHDMGEGLADHRPDNGATGHEWRTAPLWGLGLVKTISENAGYLHDGRARTVLEAILWHGGEAQASRDAMIELSTEQRQDLLSFLNSL